jgi:hypothetical protein
MTAHEFMKRQPVPASGRLLELEEKFLSNRKIPNRSKIVSLLDHAKKGLEYDRALLERLINTF